MDVVNTYGKASLKYGMAMHDGGLLQAARNLDAAYCDLLDIVYGDDQ